MKTTPLTLRDDLAAAYLRYIDTQYWLRNSGLSDERRALLRADGNLRSECLLEPVLPYDATVDLLATTAAAGISAESAEIVGRALFGDFTDPGQPVKLRDHQAEAVTSHFRSGSEAGRNVVVTSGTGSGKTEKLLLPMLLRLVEEARTWSRQPPPDLWWKDKPHPRRWRPIRKGGDPDPGGPLDDPVPDQRARRGPGDQAPPGGPPDRHGATGSADLVWPLHRRHPRNLPAPCRRPRPRLRRAGGEP